MCPPSAGLVPESANEAQTTDGDQGRARPQGPKDQVRSIRYELYRTYVRKEILRLSRFDLRWRAIYLCYDY